MEKSSLKMHKVFAILLLPLSELAVAGLAIDISNIASPLSLLMWLLRVTLMVAMIIGLLRFSSFGHIIFYANLIFTVAVGAFGIIHNGFTVDYYMPIIFSLIPWPFAVVYYHKRRFLFGAYYHRGEGVEVHLSSELETTPLKWHDFITCVVLPVAILLTITEFIILGAAVTKATHAFSFPHLMVCLAEIITIIITMALLMMLTAFSGNGQKLLRVQPVVVVAKTAVLYLALPTISTVFIVFTVISITLTLCTALSFIYYRKRVRLFSR